MTCLINLFHRDQFKKKELERSAREFFVWKRQIDEDYYEREYQTSGITDHKYFARCCGRERARLLNDCSVTLNVKYAIEYRLNNSISSRFSHMLKCIAPDDDLKYYLFCALEMFRIAFVPEVNHDRRRELPSCKTWLIDYICQEVNLLTSNSFDQAHYGQMPVFHSIDRVRSLVTLTFYSASTPSLDVRSGLNTLNVATTKNRFLKYRERLQKSRNIPILTRRLSPSRITPPTRPIPDTSDGVGSIT